MKWRSKALDKLITLGSLRVQKTLPEQNKAIKALVKRKKRYGMNWFISNLQT